METRKVSLHFIFHVIFYTFLSWQGIYVYTTIGDSITVYIGSPNYLLVYFEYDIDFLKYENAFQ